MLKWTIAKRRDDNWYKRTCQLIQAFGVRAVIARLGRYVRIVATEL
jgi:hypothetical protein